MPCHLDTWKTAKSVDPNFHCVYQNKFMFERRTTIYTLKYANTLVEEHFKWGSLCKSI